MDVKQRQEQWIRANQAEYESGYEQLSFLSPSAAEAARRQREELLQAIHPTVSIGCGGTKLDCRSLSPGCAACVAGTWSCLFINGRCNCRCFYCPSDQTEIGLPATNTITFRHPDDYVAYIDRFGFRGVSFSGGEPLLTLNRTLGFLRAVKSTFGDRVHTWLYSNGSLVTEEVLQKLRSAGLDEMRFDIGAVGYRIDAARLAARYIPCVTVEIPSVPEDEQRLRHLLPQLREAGVAFLNLHQLRLTPHNFAHLAARPYTFLHGEKVTVLDSELTALRLLEYSLEQGDLLPINYCSFVYKNRYQRWAARRRNAELVRKSHEDMTAAAFLRSLCLTGSLEEIGQCVDALTAMGVEPGRWQLDKSKEKLLVAAEILPLLPADVGTLSVTYSEASQMSHLTYRHYYVEVKLSQRQKLIIEKRQQGPSLEIAAQMRDSFLKVVQGDEEPVFSVDNPPWLPFERMIQGLQDYY